jgi:hypothetical protein
MQIDHQVLKFGPKPVCCWMKEHLFLSSGPTLWSAVTLKSSNQFGSSVDRVSKTHRSHLLRVLTPPDPGWPQLCSIASMQVPVSSPSSSPSSLHIMQSSASPPLASIASHPTLPDYPPSPGRSTVPASLPPVTWEQLVQTLHVQSGTAQHAAIGTALDHTCTLRSNIALQQHGRATVTSQ